MESLPNELLELILEPFSFVDYDNDPRISKEETISAYFQSKSILRNVCLTSKTLKAIAEPYLYRSYLKVASIETRGHMVDGTPSTWEVRRFQAFLRKILTQPELARAVNEFLVLGWEWIFPQLTQADHRSVPEDFLQLSKAALEALPWCSPMTRQLWLEHIILGSEDAYMALVLAQTHSLERLHMCLPNGIMECTCERHSLDRYRNYRPAYAAVFQMALVGKHPPFS